MITEVPNDVIDQNDALPCYGFVRGEAVTSLPVDLYIPPDALEVVWLILRGSIWNIWKR